MRECGRAFEFDARVIRAPELLEQIGADARQEMICAQRWFVEQRIDEFQPALRSERHADRDRAVEMYDRRRMHLRERIVERRDAFPIGCIGCARARMAGGDRRLKTIASERLR
jgi:hypothetical protein